MHLNAEQTDHRASSDQISVPLIPHRAIPIAFVRGVFLFVRQASKPLIQLLGRDLFSRPIAEVIGTAGRGAGDRRRAA